MIETPTFWIVAVFAVALLGLSKGGFAGMGALSLPVVAMIVSPVRAAAILLPILIVQDVVSVWAFRRDWDGYVLGWMLPGAAIGIALGYLFASSVSPDAVLGLVGAVSILFGGYRLWVERHGAPQGTGGSPGWVGTIFGVASGFTSQIAHAGQPPFQLWVLPRRLPRDVLVGTTAIFFAVVNWVKVPAYVALGQFTRANLTVAAMLLPVAIVSTAAGVWLVRRVPAERFYRVIYVLMIAVGLKLVWDALV
ncbi:sulfite exporter TauE/SafE family protein [Sphingomonas floccifaciens]|uniref:Probable membrane transporter protein n=1 Tax=Sphingomonas floccifaciens TaxID=1844115 RepID=A0ABW4NE18_9SPHN